MREVAKVEAHDAEVLCLEYSKPETGKARGDPRRSQNPLGKLLLPKQPQETSFLGVSLQYAG